MTDFFGSVHNVEISNVSSAQVLEKQSCRLVIVDVSFAHKNDRDILTATLTLHKS